MKFAITARNATFNDNARGWRLAREALKYALWGEGFLANTSVPICVPLPHAAWAGDRTPHFGHAASFRLATSALSRGGAHHHARQRPALGNTGSVHIQSADLAEPPAIRFNFLSPRRPRGPLAAIRKGRELMATSAAQGADGREIAPGAHLTTDDELLDWVRHNAETTYHPVGTQDGHDPMAVVDHELRVHGIQGLRVVPMPRSCPR